MNKKDCKPYSHPRWTEIPGAEVLGHVERTEDEKKKADEELEKIITHFEQLKNGSIQNQ